MNTHEFTGQFSIKNYSIIEGRNIQPINVGSYEGTLFKLLTYYNRD